MKKHQRPRQPRRRLTVERCEPRDLLSVTPTLRSVALDAAPNLTLGDRADFSHLSVDQLTAAVGDIVTPDPGAGVVGWGGAYTPPVDGLQSLTPSTRAYLNDAEPVVGSVDVLVANGSSWVVGGVDFVFDGERSVTNSYFAAGPVSDRDADFSSFVDRIIDRPEAGAGLTLAPSVAVAPLPTVLPPLPDPTAPSVVLAIKSIAREPDLVFQYKTGVDHRTPLSSLPTAAPVEDLLDWREVVVNHAPVANGAASGVATTANSDAPSILDDGSVLLEPSYDPSTEASFVIAESGPTAPATDTVVTNTPSAGAAADTGVTDFRPEALAEQAPIDTDRADFDLALEWTVAGEPSHAHSTSSEWVTPTLGDAIVRIEAKPLASVARDSRATLDDQYETDNDADAIAEASGMIDLGRLLDEPAPAIAAALVAAEPQRDEEAVDLAFALEPWERVTLLAPLGEEPTRRLRSTPVPASTVEREAPEVDPRSSSGEAGAGTPLSWWRRGSTTSGLVLGAVVSLPAVVTALWRPSRADGDDQADRAIPHSRRQHAR